jgi:hypothetical protein
MTTSAIIEAAARALALTFDGINTWESYEERVRENYRVMAEAALAAVIPLIEAAALERAAKVAEDRDGNYSWPGASPAVLQRHSREIAAAIRALIITERTAK